MAWTPQNVPDANGYQLPDGSGNVTYGPAGGPNGPIAPAPNRPANPMTNPNVMPPADMLPGVTAAPAEAAAPLADGAPSGQTERYLSGETYGLPDAVQPNQALAPQFASQATASTMPMPASPLAAQPQPPLAPAMAGPAMPAASLVPAGTVVPASPAMGLPANAAAAQLNDEEVDADDTRWINRAKSVIQQTHGDPFRQVQLLQQLRVMYLKEKYGRIVQAKDR